MRTFDHFIGGSVTPPASGQYLSSTSPVDGSVVAQVARGNQVDVHRAVDAAQRGLDQWRSLKPIERGRILMEVARTMRRQQDDLITIEIADTGKTTAQATAEVVGAINYFEFYAGLVNLPIGEVLDLGPEDHIYTRREPFGVVGIITPWNGPLNQAARGIAPALAAGNAVVVKPSEFTSGTTVKLASIAGECGLPKGCLNIVLGTGPEVGAEISKHPDVRKLAFTGSIRAGREVGSIAAERIIPVTLELGGKSANIIFSDADLDRAVPAAVNAFITNAGQVCSAGTRLLVQKSIVEEVLEGLKRTVKQLEIGEHFGPITTENQYRKVCQYFDVARLEGLECIAGGTPLENQKGGYFVPPSIYYCPDRDSRLYEEEIFGPVLIVSSFETEDEAVAIANESAYGLVAGLWSTDASRVHRVAALLEAGQIFINNWGGGGVETPFGGYKASGIGREKGMEALHHYTQLKCVIQKLY